MGKERLKMAKSNSCFLELLSNFVPFPLISGGLAHFCPDFFYYYVPIIFGPFSCGFPASFRSIHYLGVEKQITTSIIPLNLNFDVLTILKSTDAF